MADEPVDVAGPAGLAVQLRAVEALARAVDARFARDATLSTTKTALGMQVTNTAIVGMAGSKLTGDVAQAQIQTNVVAAVNANGGSIDIAGSVRSAGLIADADPAGVVGTVTYSNAENSGTARSTGVGTVLFADGTNRDAIGFIKVRLGTTVGYVPVFAAN